MWKHGKVAVRKSRAYLLRYQRRLIIKEITRLINTITLKSNVIAALEGPSQVAKEMKCCGFTQQLDETQKEHKALIDRKNELSSDTVFHRVQLEMIKKSIANFEDQVTNHIDFCYSANTHLACPAVHDNCA